MDAQTKWPRFRRKQYLISPRFQLKYAGLILALMFSTAALCAYVVYYTTMVSMGERLANVYPQGQLVHIVSTVNFKILVSMILISPLVVIFGIFLSHRIAGPVFRIERFLDAVAKGDFSSHLTLRKNDELKGFAEGINGACDTVRSYLNNQRLHLTKMLNEASAISSKMPDPSAADKLKDEISGLLKELDKFKT